MVAGPCRRRHLKLFWLEKSSRPEKILYLVVGAARRQRESCVFNEHLFGHR